MSQKKVIIISGGTLVHIRPHFSLCAPAYGVIGDNIKEKFDNYGKKVNFSVILHKTKMADSNSLIETNDDMSNYIDMLLKDNSIVGIIMCAAICDFKVDAILPVKDEKVFDTNVGKQFNRLSSTYIDGSNRELFLLLSPTDKLINRIKLSRPDILLATFKTTTDESEGELIDKCIESYKNNGSDIIFGNDIKRKTNLLYFGKTNTPVLFDRDSCIDGLVSTFLEELC